MARQSAPARKVAAAKSSAAKPAAKPAAKVAAPAAVPALTFSETTIEKTSNRVSANPFAAPLTELKSTMKSQPTRALSFPFTGDEAAQDTLRNQIRRAATDVGVSAVVVFEGGQCKFRVRDRITRTRAASA